VIPTGLTSFGNSNGDRRILKAIDVFEFDIDAMEIRVEGSILVEAVGSSKKPVCEPMAGFFAGFLSELLGKKVEVKETTCTAQGHEKCIFKISIK
jgi:Predicted hydrocarbon binding protein (contains V4R domain)